MNCTLTRKIANEFGIFSSLDADSGPLFHLVTLEHAYPVGSGFAPKIPVGVYTCERYFSPSHGYELFVLRNVAGHTVLELHIGNFNQDSKGCILLGLMKGDSSICASREAFKKFMELQKGAATFQLSVRDAYPP